MGTIENLQELVNFIWNIILIIYDFIVSIPTIIENVINFILSIINYIPNPFNEFILLLLSIGTIFLIYHLIRG